MAIYKACNHGQGEFTNSLGDPENRYSKLIKTDFNIEEPVFDFNGEYATEFACAMIEDTYSSFTNSRLTTLAIRLPWALTPELLRHRAFSFCSASTRAIPPERFHANLQHRYEPKYWNKNVGGMQPNESLELSPEEITQVSVAYMQAFDETCWAVSEGNNVKVAKQDVNYLLTPYLWCELIVTATNWKNFFKLRLHPSARREIRIMAEMMIYAISNHTPKVCDLTLESFQDSSFMNQYHLPFVTKAEIANYRLEKDEMDIPLVYKLSAARCARVSYKSHTGELSTVKDFSLANTLRDADPIHASPFEHCGVAVRQRKMIRNFFAFEQARVIAEEKLEDTDLTYDGVEFIR
jgi:thymidylate synthase ThyX